jgi:mRNA-degrading endonuclease RelE of RelBE toxin-antitoxin system
MKMYTVIETAMFQRYASDVWSEDDRLAFIAFLAADPEAGAVIPEAAPLRKVRWSREGMGKRGGVRVIYYVMHENETCILLIVYSKSKVNNLSKVFLVELRKLVG